MLRVIALLAAVALIALVCIFVKSAILAFFATWVILIIWAGIDLFLL